MSDTDKKKNQESDPTKDPAFKKVVKHFLNTPPKPHSKRSKETLTESDHQKKPDGTSVKKRRPEDH